MKVLEKVGRKKGNYSESKAGLARHMLRQNCFTNTYREIKEQKWSKTKNKRDTSVRIMWYVFMEYACLQPDLIMLLISYC